MSAILEEYGRVILVIIVIAALIGIVAFFKLSGLSFARGSFQSFVSTSEDINDENPEGHLISVDMQDAGSFDENPDEYLLEMPTPDTPDTPDGE